MNSNVKVTADTIIDEIRKKSEQKEHIIVAIDGRCASGKTTLAEKLRECINCNVVHMDHFFLRPEQRTEKRFSEPGGNVDRERFREEVIEGFLTGGAFSYRMFDCRTMTLGEYIDIKENAVTIVEGTYSCHPELRDFYDLRIFMTTSEKEQLSRLEIRNPEKLEMFKTRWIPFEERYFEGCSVKENCDIVYET